MVDINRTLFSLNREQEERHTEELAKSLNLPYINLTNYQITPDLLNLIPEDIAMQHQFIPYLKVGSTIKIGVTDTDNPSRQKFLDDFSQKSKITFQPAIISKTSLMYGFIIYEKKKEDEKKAKDAITKEKEESYEDQIKDLKTAADVARKVSTTKLLDVIIMGAIKTKSSDIHLEPGPDTFLIRYRVDGVLQDVVKLPKSQYSSLLSRIKYLAHLRMDEDNKPQDGRFSFLAIDTEIDLRISTLPSSDGETIVMRLLSRNQERKTLDSLGLRSDALVMIRAAMSKPHGLLITSGPTGSGKTSTLYAMLTELNTHERKIITLEDPIEYKIEGIEQSQIDKESEYNFADGLRASLRQDPDIIMVGEIRDAETAEIAIQAGLTGHLVLSTVHANTAPSVFARLLDIGVKPFLLSGSFNIVMAQRLVRKLCLHCAEVYTPESETWKEIKVSLAKIAESLDSRTLNNLRAEKPLLRRAKGCGYCNHTGFSGRLAIIELLIPDEAIGRLIKEKAGIMEFEKASRESGMISMEQDGLIKVVNGYTTVEEVWRVTKE